MARFDTLQGTEDILDEIIAELKRADSGDGFAPMATAVKFSRRSMADLDKVLSAAMLPAAVVIYDGSSYQRGRPPTRIARVAVVARVPAKGDPETAAEDAREQLDACRDRLDEHTFGNAVVYAVADGVTEGRAGSINYYVTLEVLDH